MGEETPPQGNPDAVHDRDRRMIADGEESEEGDSFFLEKLEQECKRLRTGGASANDADSFGLFQS
jgi:hypothetical protein